MVFSCRRFYFFDATKEEIIEFYIDEAKKRAAEEVERELRELKSNKYQKMTFGEALEQRTWNKSIKELELDKNYIEWLEKQRLIK
jgi:hypothetical protein